jgi:hypothetical protein
MTMRRLGCGVMLLWLACMLTACMTVPPEVVQLSSLTTSDTRTLHDGYRSLVRKHFAALRKAREQEFADKVLAPYIEEAIAAGRLFEVMHGDVVWDNARSDFVKPNPAKATFQKLDTLNTWTRQVAADIEGLRKDAFADLDKLENEVLDQVDVAFGNVVRGGSTVHAYLLSLQKVEAAQNDFLKGIGLGELPGKLNAALDKASNDAATWTAKADDANAKAKMLKDTVKKAKGK